MYLKIVNHIENEIINGHIGKGDKLPTERKMAENLGVSRASVREAIKTLEAMGIIVSIQGSGNYITDQPEESIDRAFCTLFALNNGTLDNLMQLRIVLECEAFKDIIKYASNEDIEHLVAAADYNYFDDSIENQTSYDRNFHHSIVEQSQNTLIRYLYNTLSALFDVYRSHVLAATLQRNDNITTRNDHFEIVSALKAKNLDAASLALQKHLMSDDYREILDKTMRTIN